MDNLIYKEEKQSDGYWYKYWVDQQGRKQGEMRVYFPDDDGNITDKLHMILNWMNDKYFGLCHGFDRNNNAFLRTNFDENGKLDGLTELINDKDDVKKIWFKNGNRVHENGAPCFDKNGYKLNDDGTDGTYHISTKM